MITLTINKKKHTIAIKDHETLLEVLRDRLGLTGTKTACEEGECGACTVIVDGKTVLSCLTLAKTLEGKDITTIEGLSEGDNLHPIQQAFLDQGAVQCGFCTPGMVLASKALLDENPLPSQEEIEHGLDGNLCRCAGYLRIAAAIKQAAEDMSKKAGKA